MRKTVLAAFAILASGCSAPGLAPEAADDPPPSSRRGPDPVVERGVSGALRGPLMEDTSTKIPPRSEPSVSVAISDWIIWGPAPTGDVDDGCEQIATAEDPREVAP
jgi:hypothetical protein